MNDLPSPLHRQRMAPEARRTVDKVAIRTAEDGDLVRATTRLDDRVLAENALINRLLGLPQGSVTLSNPTEHRLMLRKVTHS